MEEPIRREEHQKLYVQLIDILRKKIEDKDWDVGFQIPTEEDLCKNYGVSRATVRSAIAELVREGYLFRQQGKGTFVKQIVSNKLVMLTSFREFMLEPGVEFSTEVRVQTTMMPIGTIGNLLDIPLDKHIIYIKRITILENKPVIIQEIHIPLHICPDLLHENVAVESLFAIFKKYKIEITRVRNYFGIVHLNAEEARTFNVTEGLPALLLNQLFFSGDTPVMYIRSVKRHDSFGFAIEFKKSAMG
jgi:GntR family transcriptional regulator